VKSLSSQIEIDASSEAVWAVLIDFDAYAAWNPVEIHAKGEAVVGASFEHTAQLPERNSMTFKAKITEATPHRALAWKGRLVVSGLFDGHHRFNIEPISDNRCRLRQSEQFTGVLVPFLGRALRDTEKAFEITNAAIKQRAEALADTDNATAQ
jgi:hypothetical protein